jgi:hypothetical protein
MPGCSSGSDSPHTIAALGIHHENHHALDHADRGEPVLAVVLAIVDPADREGIGKHQARTLERHAMVGEVRGGFGGVPFEASSFMTVLLSSSPGQVSIGAVQERSWVQAISTRFHEEIDRPAPTPLSAFRQNRGIRCRI